MPRLTHKLRETARRVDREWFRERYFDVGVKGSDLAAEVGLDPCQLAELARLLDLPTRREAGIVFKGESTRANRVHALAWNGCNRSCPAWADCRRSGTGQVMPCEVVVFEDEDPELYEGAGWPLNLRPMGDMVLKV